MRHSLRLSRAVHILAYIAEDMTGDLSSDAIATSIRTNPGVVRQLMMSLRKSGLLSSTQGRAAPHLTVAPEQITLAMIYRAVEGDKPLLHLAQEINEDCGLGVSLQMALRDYYEDIQNRVVSYMDSITLADVVDSSHQIREELIASGMRSEQDEPMLKEPLRR